MHTCIHDDLIHDMNGKLDTVCQYVSDRQAVYRAKEEQWQRIKDRATIVAMIITAVGGVVGIYAYFVG